MKQIKDFDNVQPAGSFERPAADGYVCIIRHVEDHPDKEFLHIEFDIAEGKFKGYAAETAERAGFWPLRCNRFYGAKGVSFFKAFIEAVEATNKGYRWDWNEQSLVGKGVGIVFREEEYLARDGSIRKSIAPFEFKTATQIRDGDFTVPAPKTVSQAAAAPATFVEDDTELPF